VRLAGTLHVSLPTDIIQLFGTGSVPVLVAGSVLGVFELGERFASQRTKDALSKWLLTFDVQKTKVLPDDTQELFQKIFGERHLSVKCFFRSALFSLGAMAFISIIVLLIYPKAALELTHDFLEPPNFLPESVRSSLYGSWVQFAVWLPWSILIDYVSLFKTRLILAVLTRRIRPILVVAILGIDFLVYLIIFNAGLRLLASVPLSFIIPLGGLHPVDIYKGFVFVVPTFIISPREQLLDIFFWAGFAPSVWMWLYVLALFVTRGLLRSERILNWLRWALDVEKAPFRSIGAVAATLAFILSVAIILVSAGVSRIGAAS
jgi:hypothetical protein